MSARRLHIQIIADVSGGDEAVFQKTIKIDSSKLRTDIKEDKGYSAEDSRDEDLVNQARKLFKKIVKQYT